MDFEGIANRVAASVVGRFRVPDHLSGGRLSRVKAALAVLEAGYQNKQIWNVDYKEAKEALIRAVEGAGDVLQSDFLSYWKEQRRLHGEETWTESVSDVYYGFPSGLYQLGSFVKKLRKYDGYLLSEMDEFIEQWLPVAKAIKELKPFIEKGRKLNPDAKPKDVYVAPRTSTAGLKMIRDALEKVVVHERGKLEDQVAGRYMKAARRFLDGRESSQIVYDFYKRDPEIRPVVDRMVVETGEKSYRRSDPKTFELSGDAEGVAMRAAKGAVKDIVERYLYKNQNKIGSIVERKGGLEKIKVAYGSLAGWGFEGELVCVFGDGTQFTVRNKVVYKMSMRGTDFVQFPTTFHRVVWPDGKRSAMVPEKQMNEDWAKAVL